jgi:hypothetical protein
VSSSLGESLKSRSEEFKRNISALDKEHAKDFKKVHHSIKRKLDFLRKLERKAGGKEGNTTVLRGLRKEPVNIAGDLKIESHCEKYLEKQSTVRNVWRVVNFPNDFPLV